MAMLLGIIAGILAFIPNIGAIITGTLMIAVGFSAGQDTGFWAIGTYLLVQTFDGYVVVPMVAKRTVDMPPALTLSTQIMASALFGILGLALADPMTAMVKTALKRRSEREAARDGDGAGAQADFG
ncbi:AI-2E family transporter [Sphingomonas sp. I4]